MKQVGCRRVGVLQIYFLIVCSEGGGWGEDLSAVWSGADKDYDLLADGSVDQVEGFGVTLSLQLCFDGISFGED